MRFATLDEWLAWQETLHPRGIELGLSRVDAVYRRLQPARPAFVVISVAGTNGKGSTVRFLEAMLAAAGYRVGAYTSPHLLRYNERVRVAGEEVGDALLCAAFERVDRARGDVSLTYFEFGTLAALDIFQRSDLDVAVLEVGMGGRLDAVNVLDADLALITQVDLDHMEWLGADREAIAREKAGIMRRGVPVVCSDPQPPQALAAEAQRLDAPLFQLGRDFGYTAQAGDWAWWGPQLRRQALPLPALRGAHQLRNAAGALMALAALSGRLPVGQSAVRAGLLSAVLPGRFQVLPGSVTRVLDVAHNRAAAATLARQLDALPPGGATHAVAGMLADKDIDGALWELRERVHHWHLATLAVPRGAPAERLGAAVSGFGRPARSYGSPAAAYRGALAAARPGDRVVVFGSFYTVAAVLAGGL